MKKNKIFISLLSTLFLTSLCLSIDMPNRFTPSRVGAENSDYTLTFTSSSHLFNPINNTKEVLTGLGNPINFSYSGYALQANDWGRFTQNGYLLNETPISGLLSLEIVFGATRNPINIYYGWRNDQGHIEYESSYQVIDGLTETNFDYFNDESPSYFKLVAQDTVDIHILTLNYSCVESERPEGNIVFGTDPFNGTSATSVAGVGMALYYDATENAVPVAFDQVGFTVESPLATIGLVTKLGVYYLRATAAGSYVVKLTVEDSIGRLATRNKTITVSTGDLSGDQGAIKTAVQAMYPNNIATQLDYRASDGVFNEWVVIGKDFSVFQRVDNTGNYATVFVPFAKFEGGQRLGDFTISFKYTSLNQVWKLLFSFWTGPQGGDSFAGDYLRILVHNNNIGIQGDTQQGSTNQDNGEATGIPLKTEPVYMKFTRELTQTGDNYTVVFKLYTSADGETYALKTTATLVEQSNAAGGTAGLVWGFLPFSIDNDFIIENLHVGGTVFTIS